MRKFVVLGVGLLIASAVTCTTVSAAGIGVGKSYRGPTGLQLYSLRDQFKQQGVAPVLDKVRDWGFKYVEVAGTYGMTPVDFKAELDKRGLVPIGSHFPVRPPARRHRWRDPRGQGTGADLRRLRLDRPPGAVRRKTMPCGGRGVQPRRQGAGRTGDEVLLPQSRLRILSARPRHAVRFVDGRDGSSVRVLPDGRPVDRVSGPGSGTSCCKSTPTAGCCCT